MGVEGGIATPGLQARQRSGRPERLNRQREVVLGAPAQSLEYRGRDAAAAAGGERELVHVADRIEGLLDELAQRDCRRAGLRPAVDEEQLEAIGARVDGAAQAFDPDRVTAICVQRDPSHDLSL